MTETAVTVFVVDEGPMRAAGKPLRSVGWRAQGFASAEAFLRSPQRQETACLILDVRMPGMRGLELQRCLAGPTRLSRSSSSPPTSMGPCEAAPCRTAR